MEKQTMRRFAAAILLSVIGPTVALAGHDWIDRFCFSAATPEYPAKHFWAPRLWRLHACHWPASVTVCPPNRGDVPASHVPVGPYCPGSPLHFPFVGPAKP
jgi:hypothetical protein